jgi:hypothetical protein
MLALKQLLAPLIGSGPEPVRKPSKRMSAVSSIAAAPASAPSTLGSAASELMNRRSSPPTSSPPRGRLWIGLAAAVALVALGLGAARFSARSVKTIPATQAALPAPLVDLQVISDPGGALVTINKSKQFMRTPSVFKVPRTEHLVVQIEKDGYEPHEETIALSTQETERVVSATLERSGPSGGTIKVSTNLARGRWMLDGRPVGDGSGSLLVERVEAGPHRLKVESPGYAVKEEIVDARVAQVSEYAWALIAQHDSSHRSPDAKHGGAASAHPAGASTPSAPAVSTEKKSDGHVGATSEF